MNSETLNIASKVIASYCLFLILFGTISNLVAFIVCLRKNLFKIPTFVFYAFIMISNTLALYFINLHYALYALMGIKLLDFDISICKIGHFIQLTSSQVSSWLLVALVVERCLSVKMMLWRRQYFNSKRALITCICILIVVICITAPLLIVDTSGVVNATTPIEELYGTNVVVVELELNFYLNFLVPLPILIIADGLLILTTIRSAKNVKRINDNRKGKRKGLSSSIIVIVSLFIILNIPNGITSGYFLQKLFQQPYGFVVSYALMGMQFTYFAIGFFTFFFSNRLFKQEFLSMFKNEKVVSTTQFT